MALGFALRLSLRVLRRHAKLTAIAICSLAVGMAATVIGVSVFNATLLEPPAVPEPGRLLTVYMSTPAEPFNQLSYPDYLYLRDHNTVFSGLAAMPFSLTETTATVGGRDKHSLVNGVSDNYFSVLQAPFLLGTGFAPGDDDRVTTKAVLGYTYWRWLGSDAHILGKTVTINDVPLTIVGVTAQAFTGTILTDQPDVWYPLSAGERLFQQASNWRLDRQNVSFSPIGRLGPNVTPEAAAANLRGLSTELSDAHPETNKNRVAAVKETSMLPPDAVAPARLLCVVLLAVVALVLLAASTNVANLLLALSNLRRYELLVRAALGATRAGLIGQLLLDSAIVSAAGGVLGFGVASYALRRLMAFQPVMPGIGALPITPDFRPNLWATLVVVGLVAAVAVAIGLVPGLHASRPDLITALRGEPATGGTRRNRARHTLVAAQMAACTVVLVGVGLCLKSLITVERTDLGFSAREVAIAMVATKPGDQHALHTRIRDAIAQLGGVESVSLATQLPLDGNGTAESARQSGQPAQSGVSVHEGVVDGAYFATLGIPMLSGRVFTSEDTPTSRPVIIINRTLAERLWPRQDPINQTLVLGATGQPLTVVGVAQDSKYGDVDEAPMPYLYFALSQHDQPQLYLLARTHGGANAYLPRISAALVKVDPDMGSSTLTLNDWLNFTFYAPRLALFGVAGLGAFATLLAGIGLYGAVFYSVSDRTRELGIRVALGASRRNLIAMILRQAALVSGLGVAVGLGCGIGGTTLVRSLLYGIQPVEWLVLAGVALAIMGMTLLLAYSAVRPWLRVDPMRAVRHV